MFFTSYYGIILGRQERDGLGYNILIGTLVYSSSTNRGIAIIYMCERQRLIFSAQQ